MALLATEAVAFLDRIAEDYPEEPIEAPRTKRSASGTARTHGAAVPGAPHGLRFDPDREMVLIELQGALVKDEEEGEALPSQAEDATPTVPDVPSPIRPTRTKRGTSRASTPPAAQVRAMAAKGAEAVAAGRPLCPLCDMPMDPAGHRCPRWN